MVAFMLLLRLSVVSNVCIVAKRCVLEQKLPLTASTIDILVVYEKSIRTKMNDLDLGLEVVSRSCQPLCHIRH